MYYRPIYSQWAKYTPQKNKSVVINPWVPILELDESVVKVSICLY